MFALPLSFIQEILLSKHDLIFFQYTRRSAAEVAADKTFNKLTIKGKKLSIRWGKSQGKQEAITSGPMLAIPQVPGLPGALPAPPKAHWSSSTGGRTQSLKLHHRVSRNTIFCSGEFFLLDLINDHGHYI